VHLLVAQAYKQRETSIEPTPAEKYLRVAALDDVVDGVQQNFT
jgi:hypothetical protein